MKNILLIILLSFIIWYANNSKDKPNENVKSSYEDDGYFIFKAKLDALNPGDSLVNNDFMCFLFKDSSGKIQPHDYGHIDITRAGAEQWVLHRRKGYYVDSVFKHVDSIIKKFGARVTDESFTEDSVFTHYKKHKHTKGKIISDTPNYNRIWNNQDTILVDTTGQWEINDSTRKANWRKRVIKALPNADSMYIIYFDSLSNSKAGPYYLKVDGEPIRADSLTIKNIHRW